MDAGETVIGQLFGFEKMVQVGAGGMSASVAIAGGVDGAGI